jgi:L-amino acid N-acyltransferase YncA
MERSRSEYLLAPIPHLEPDPAITTRPVARTHRAAIARLVLDGYRGTIDDEGEDLDDALAAVDTWFALLLPDHSTEIVDGTEIVAISFVVAVDGRPYIDPVVVASRRKRRGLGRHAVAASLASLATAGFDSVGATVTDGNVASERLFARLGFRRIGPWPRP